MTVIIQVIGISRRSGKTTLVESITRHFSENFTVWTVKHISTTFDTADKDTLRHLQAGAKTVIAVTKNEIIRIKSILGSLDAALMEVPESINLLLVEGFKESDYPKIITVREMKDAAGLLNSVSNVFAIYRGEAAESDSNNVGSIPVMQLETIISKIEEFILADIVTRLPGLNCKSCGFPSCEALAHEILEGTATLEKCKALLESKINLIVDGLSIPLSSFPRELMRNTVLGMINSLKGVGKTKISQIHLDIKV